MLLTTLWSPLYSPWGGTRSHILQTQGPSAGAEQPSRDGSGIWSSARLPSGSSFSFFKLIKDKTQQIDPQYCTRGAHVQHFRIQNMQNQQENGAGGAEGAPDFAGVEGFVEEDDAESEQDAHAPDAQPWSRLPCRHLMTLPTSYVMV